MKMVRGNKVQKSVSKSRKNTWGWGLCGESKIQLVLAFVVAIAAISTVTGKDEGRISLGTIPPPGKYPSLARLLDQNPETGEFLTSCVVSIINRDWLVTTGLCVAEYSGPIRVNTLKVVVGDEIDNETEPYERMHDVERVIIHHRFENRKAPSNRQRGDDIALVKVKPQIQFSNRVTPANFPTCNEFETGLGLVAGYGVRQEGFEKHYNYRLTEITNKIIPQDECSRRLNRKVDDRIFCVQAINKTSTCFEDFGAPFYVSKSDSQMVMVGMMSTWPDGDWCGVGDNDITTFTRLSSYMGWIHRRISGCGNHPWFNVTEQ